ncbi:3757_t:CDS:2, partial [Paraglomus brasilianum]
YEIKDKYTFTVRLQRITQRHALELELKDFVKHCADGCQRQDGSFVLNRRSARLFNFTSEAELISAFTARTTNNSTRESSLQFL